MLLKDIIMTTNPEQAARDRTDPMVDARLTALMASLISPARTVSQASSFEKVILAAALAPALADALAPALAEALAPAIVKALNTIVSPKETGRESVPKEDTDKQEGKKSKSYG